jgi:hypothetical protein
MSEERVGFIVLRGPGMSLQVSVQHFRQAQLLGACMFGGKTLRTATATPARNFRAGITLVARILDNGPARRVTPGQGGHEGDRVRVALLLSYRRGRVT